MSLTENPLPNAGVDAEMEEFRRERTAHGVDVLVGELEIEMAQQSPHPVAEDLPEL